MHVLLSWDKARPGWQKQTPPVSDGPHLCSQFNDGQDDWLQAISSSALSSQSFLKLQSWDLSMHFGVPFGPPLGHKNLLSGHAIAVQFASSLSSAQSWYLK